MAEKSLLVIDGSAVLTTQYFGSLPEELRHEKDEERKAQLQHLIRHNSEGKYTNAVYGTLNMFFRIISTLTFDYVAFVLDRSRNTFRRELYPEYKANRSTKPDSLKEQFATLTEILQGMGICVLDSDRYEADDIAGTILTRFANEDLNKFFLTKDHDYLQLIDNRTCGFLLQTNEETVESFYGGQIPPWMPYKTILYSSRTVKSLEGVYPDQIPDLKGIVGDTADNIPGINGIKSAAPLLLSRYKTMERIYAAIDARGNDPKAEKQLEDAWRAELGVRGGTLKRFKENREIAYLSKELATIQTDVPIPPQLDSYALRINQAEARRLLEKYELYELESYYPVLLGVTPHTF